jgi:probable F420-dependent oxidoreductase
MRIGVIYPQTEFVEDPIWIRDFAQAVEGMGYRHILAYEHILGIKPERADAWNGPYTFEDSFLEPFVLFGFMAGVTSTLEFCTGVLVLPQRDTALVAKQAACLDILSGGRLRLGVGVGWNRFEFAALSRDFHHRGRKIDEQVELLRILWREPVVDFHGKWHTINQAGLNPLPAAGSIPLWFGGGDDRVLRRVARSGDGWIPPGKPAQDVRADLEVLAGYLHEEGRSIDDVGVEGRVRYGDGSPERIVDALDAWEKIGATHVSINTMRSGLSGPWGHLEALRRVADRLLLAGDDPV